MIKNSFLTGTKIVKEANSPINGKVSVVKSIGFGTYIQVEGLTQSGGVIWGIWKKTLKKIRKEKPDIKNFLILGLGGGTAASIIKKFWPKAEITGVDIDPVIVELGKKYLGISDVKIKIQDAYDFVKKVIKKKKKYDLILIDTYIFDEYPKKLESSRFLKRARKLLKKDGFAVFNRLYWGKKRKQAVKFGERLERIFPDVKVYYPEANIMFICSK